MPYQNPVSTFNKAAKDFRDYRQPLDALVACKALQEALPQLSDPAQKTRMINTFTEALTETIGSIKTQRSETAIGKYTALSVRMFNLLSDVSPESVSAGSPLAALIDQEAHATARASMRSTSKSIGGALGRSADTLALMRRVAQPESPFKPQGHRFKI